MKKTHKKQIRGSFTGCHFFNSLLFIIPTKEAFAFANQY